MNHLAHSEASKSAKTAESNLKMKIDEIENNNAKYESELRRYALFRTNKSLLLMMECLLVTRNYRQVSLLSCPIPRWLNLIVSEPNTTKNRKNANSYGKTSVNCALLQQLWAYRPQRCSLSVLFRLRLPLLLQDPILPGVAPRLLLPLPRHPFRDIIPCTPDLRLYLAQHALIRPVHPVRTLPRRSFRVRIPLVLALPLVALILRDQVQCLLLYLLLPLFLRVRIRPHRRFRLFPGLMRALRHLPSGLIHPPHLRSPPYLGSLRLRPHL